MKKLLGILVLIFNLVLLNSCGPSTMNIPGVGEVGWNIDDCHWKDEICIWNFFKTKPYPYKIYGTYMSGYYAGAPTYSMSSTAEHTALKIFFNQSQCKEGCKVTHIGINRIDKSKEIELAEQYMPPLLFDKFYPNTRKTSTNTKSNSVKKKPPKKKPPKKKDKDLTDEELWDKILETFFGNRELHKIEGVWSYKREEEKEPRIYAMVKSDSNDYLYEEIVLFHPVKEFLTLTSTKVTKKINSNKYEMKAGFGIDEMKYRDGTITQMNKFTLKFEAEEHCLSSEEKCLPEYEYIKNKIWPEETYGEKENLTPKQIEKIKDIIK